MSDFYKRVKSDPLQFYLHSLLGDYKFRVNGDFLEVSPFFAIDSEMAMLLKQHKPVLIKLIS
jgi:hypothetical protein